MPGPVIDEAEQVSAVRFKTFKHAHHFLRWLTVSAIRHQFGIAQDGVERRAQLMAHIGKELRLVLARLFKLPALVLDFVEEAYILNRDSGLVGKCRDQLDLLVGEWLYFRARQTQDTDCNALERRGPCCNLPVSVLRPKCIRNQSLHRQYEPRDLRLGRVLTPFLARP